MRLIAAACLFAVLPCVAAGQAARPDGDALMKRAETLMLSDIEGAQDAVDKARTAYATVDGADAPQVALADYRLALLRALGGDRAGQLRPMATAARLYAARAATPEQRTGAAQALVVVASFTMSSGEAQLTEALLGEGLAMLARTDLADNADLAEAHRVVGDVHIFHNRHADALPWVERAVAGYRRHAPESPALIYALARMGSALQSLSRFPEALEVLRRAVEESDRGNRNDPTVPLAALRSLGNYYRAIGQPERALPILNSALVEAEKLPPGFPYAGGLMRDIMNTLLDAGRLAETRVYAEETAKRTQATMGDNSYEYASALLVIARLDTQEGRFAAAAERIDRADAIFAAGLATANNRRFEALAARAALMTATGRHGAAAALYDTAAAQLAARPRSDVDRIDQEQGRAAARLMGGQPTPEAWTAARVAADGLTERVVGQASATAAVDFARNRNDRVYATALDAAWSIARGQSPNIVTPP